MASIVEGYSYDIFISYRHKDNKGDLWVSQFVEALKTELESSFKEEIGVYFDNNPRDGILETHDVDESLRGKLKCLTFIPIVSRTYCDPKSYAWEHEFKVFVRQASQDQFGLKVKLPDSNVANRVVPVRIHDLENSDIRQFESILGGFFRGVDFIYKSPGVNRPLSSKDDDIIKKTDQTLYRDQINKVALAVKDIIEGIKKISHNQVEIDKEYDYSEQESGVLLDYRGEINSDAIDQIIERLKRSKVYKTLDKNQAKKIYAILVECLGNISRHSLNTSAVNNIPDPYLSVSTQDEEIIITAGNPVSERSKNELIRRLDQISRSDKESLKILYDTRISKKPENERSAGLGFIIMALKSDKIEYNFTGTDYNYFIFEIKISIVCDLIKKLVIGQTASSPKVILDPDKKIFEISGESFPDDFVGFYKGILKWLNDFDKCLAGQKIDLEPIVFNFKFEFFNSSSAVYILEIFKVLARIRSRGCNIKVKWHYLFDDEEMLEAGKDMSRIADLPFDYIKIQK